MIGNLKSPHQLVATILHHALRRIARARFAPHRHRADVRGGGVLCHARYHREISQSLHEHAAGGMGALYRRVPVPVHRVEPVDPPGSHPHQPAGAADRAFGAAAGIDALQFSGAAIPSARRGDRARVLHAVLRCGALGPGVGGVGALAALGRVRGGLPRRAGGDPSGRGELPTGGAAVAHRRALLRALFHRHPRSRPHRFQRDHPVLLEYRGALALLPVVPFVWTTPSDPLVIALMVATGAMGSFGHYLLIAAHRLAPAAVLSPFIYTEIALVTATGFLVFGDVPNRSTLTGAAIVVASGLYILHRERTVRRTKDPRSVVNKE